MNIYKSRLVLVIIFILVFLRVSILAQDKTVQAYIAVSANATADSVVPFWMRSMKYGRIPLDGNSFSAEGGIKKIYNQEVQKRFDWGGSFEGRINKGNTKETILIEAYLKAKYSIFQIKAGRSKDIIGIVDSTLSIGAFSVSGNALGIPKVEISIPEYWDIPLTKGLLAIKGNFAHGWMGKNKILTTEDMLFVDTYLHQKSLYGRIGKQGWKIHIFGGFNHQAMWGNENQIYEHHLSDLETFKYVFLGKAYHPGNFPGSKIGNHIGSVDQAVTIDFKNILLTGYHQFFYEAGALAYLDNVKDGIFGFSIQNKRNRMSNFRIDKFLIEYINTKSQGGEIDSKPRPSVAEDYYNNFVYQNGWSYKEENIGTPLVTSSKYMIKGLPANETHYFTNNRVTGYHMGLDLSLESWRFKLLSTYTKNYGTYHTAPEHKGFGDTVVYNDPPYFGMVEQFSGSFECLKYFKHGFQVVGNFYWDRGDLLYNSTGATVKIVKTW